MMGLCHYQDDRIISSRLIMLQYFAANIKYHRKFIYLIKYIVFTVFTTHNGYIKSLFSESVKSNAVMSTASVDFFSPNST